MKIFIVDDHPLVRKGLVSVLSIEDDIEIAGEAENVKNAVDGILNSKPDMVLIDLRLDGEWGLDVINQLQSKGLSCRFIILTSSSDEEDFKTAEKLGVDGYILKQALPEEIVYGVKLVGRNRKYYDPEIMQSILNEKNNGKIGELTDRERDVLIALGKGMNNREIAKTLYITEFTVKKHVSQILSKLNLGDRTQAALYANARGIVKYLE